MKRYEAYKNSEFEWLGKVPIEWENWKLSHAFNKIGSGTTPESGNPIYHEGGTVNWLNTGDLNNGILDSTSKKITDKALEDYSSLKIYPKGSLAIAMYGATIGKTSILNFETTTNQACCVFTESEIINIKFLHYWFQSHKEHIINLAIGGGQPNISQDILRGIRLYCPKINEQTTIANYLDHKTTQLDTLITKKEKLIELLQEERTAIINHAVTKGLNPNTPMKDSGIEWLGEIPEHWEVKKLKYVIKDLLSGVSVNSLETSVSDNSEIGILKTSCVYDYSFRPEENKLVVKEEYDRVKCPVTKNTIIISRMNTPELVGASGYVEVDYLNLYLPDRLWKTSFHENIEINVKWLSQMLISDLYRKTLASRATGTSPSMKNISKEDLLSLPIPFPSKVEQDQISIFLLQNDVNISQVTSKIANEVELLKEYKTALISEVVTGKVDVRNELLN